MRPALAAVIALAMLACPWRASLAESTPLRPYRVLERTDLAMAAAGGIAAADANGGGTGTLALAGVSGDVTLALLYWHGIDIEDAAKGFSGGNTDYDQAAIFFDGAPVTGTRVAGNGDNNGWPSSGNSPDSGALYRADVTALVQARGNGDYVFDGLADGPGHSASGLSLIVYFDDGNPVNDLHVTHQEGLLNVAEATWLFEFAVDYAGGPVEAWMHVADGQSELADGVLTFRFESGIPGIVGEDTLRFSSPLYDGKPMWGGQSVPNLGHPRSLANAGLWDMRRLPLSGRFGPPGQYRLRADYPAAQEAVSLLVLQVVRPADPRESMLSPNPFDFGDVLIGTQSATERFTLRNLLPHPIRIEGTPAATSARYLVVAETCTGQTLAPDAACTIDLACAPTSFAVLRNSSLRVDWAPTTAGDDQVSFAPLRCAGVPPTPFSRVEIDPVQFDFGRVTFATRSPTRDFAIRNTGTLPLTFTLVGISGTHRSAFHLVANDCAARTLQPGEACHAGVQFQAPPASTSLHTAELSVGWTASDTDGDAEGATLTGRGMPDPSRIFRDSFE